jgi:hypothetical protein
VAFLRRKLRLPFRAGGIRRKTGKKENIEQGTRDVEYRGRSVNDELLLTSKFSLDIRHPLFLVRYSLFPPTFPTSCLFFWQNQYLYFIGPLRLRAFARNFCAQKREGAKGFDSKGLSFMSSKLA